MISEMGPSCYVGDDVAACGTDDEGSGGNVDDDDYDDDDDDSDGVGGWSLWFVTNTKSLRPRSDQFEHDAEIVVSESESHGGIMNDARHAPRLPIQPDPSRFNVPRLRVDLVKRGRRSQAASLKKACFALGPLC